MQNIRAIASFLGIIFATLVVGCNPAPRDRAAQHAERFPFEAEEQLSVRTNGGILRGAAVVYSSADRWKIGSVVHLAITFHCDDRSVPAWLYNPCFVPLAYSPARFAVYDLHHRYLGCYFDDPVAGSYAPSAEGTWWYAQPGGIMGARLTLTAGKLPGKSAAIWLAPGVYYGQAIYLGTFLGYSGNGASYTPESMGPGPWVFNEGILMRSNLIRFELF